MFYKDKIIEIAGQLDEIEQKFVEEEYDNLEDRVYELEEKVVEYIDITEGQESILFEKLLKRIATIKRENDFYDADAELDRMFPDRHDEDFDEDSMSYDSVFGDD